jgi:hypothetical protein
LCLIRLDAVQAVRSVLAGEKHDVAFRGRLDGVDMVQQFGVGVNAIHATLTRDFGHLHRVQIKRANLNLMVGAAEIVMGHSRSAASARWPALPSELCLSAEMPPALRKFPVPVPEFPVTQKHFPVPLCREFSSKSLQRRH